MQGRPWRAHSHRWSDPQRLRSLFAVVLLASVAVVATTACGGSDDPAAPTTDAAALERFCDRAEQFTRTLSTVDAGRVESFDVVAAAVDGLARAAPEPIAADLSTMNDYWQRLAAVETEDAGEVSGLVEPDPATEAATQRVTAYLVDECGIQPPT